MKNVAKVVGKTVAQAVPVVVSNTNIPVDRGGGGTQKNGWQLQAYAMTPSPIAVDKFAYRISL